MENQIMFESDPGFIFTILVALLSYQIPVTPNLLPNLPSPQMVIYIPHNPINHHNDNNDTQRLASTTTLMDDSPLKVPWNHLCVSEYGSKRRKLNVELAERDLELMWLSEREHASEISSSEATAEEGERRTGDETMKSSEETDKETGRKRKRKEKKMKEKKLLLAKEQREKEEMGWESYDET